MNRVLTLVQPRQLEWRDEALPLLEATQVRVKTLFSGISSGTELTQYRGTNPLLGKRFDPQTRLFVEDREAPGYPLIGWGYEQSGEVTEIGSSVRGVRVGQRVWGSWGHRRFATLEASVVAPRILPEDLEPRLGVFGRIGAIALNVVHDANIRLGDWVAVFGLGVVGLLAVQFARISGARVIAVDTNETRLELARGCGAAHVVNPLRGDAARRIKTITDHGADVCLECSGAYPALHDAVRAVRYNAAVVAAGFYQGEASALRLGEEFHHNRVQLICSQTSGVNPALQHRWDRLRLEQTVMRLAAERHLELTPLVTHELPAEDAARGFALLDEGVRDVVQIVLNLEDNP
jgi:2-desacetyl-2-hydroxyethyl bacteriochlorophyllide A dehydrogenase